MNALGFVSRTTRTACGHISRESRWPRCFPPREKGWQGGPPETSETRPSWTRKSISRTSPSASGQFETYAVPRAWLSRIVSQQYLSHSTTVSGTKPARLTPKPRPPAPANNSMDCTIGFPPKTRPACSLNVLYARFRIPIQPVCASPFSEAFDNSSRLAHGSFEASAPKNLGEILANAPVCRQNRGVYAKNNRERKLPSCGAGTPNLGFLGGRADEAGSDSPCHESYGGQSFLAGYPCSESDPCARYVLPG